MPKGKGYGLTKRKPKKRRKGSWRERMKFSKRKKK